MIRFMYNGIKKDKTLYKAWYSIGQLTNYPEGTITIYAREYTSFPQIEGLNIENNSDSMTDYFDKDKIRVTPNNKHYIAVLEAYRKQEEHRQKQTDKRNIETIEAKKEAATIQTNEVIEEAKNIDNIVYLKEIGATPRQLWALHCATGLNTKNLNITLTKATELIKKSMNGENIIKELKELIIKTA